LRQNIDNFDPRRADQHNQELAARKGIRINGSKKNELTIYLFISGLVINGVSILELSAVRDDHVMIAGNVVMEIQPIRHHGRCGLNHYRTLIRIAIDESHTVTKSTCTENESSI